MKIIWAIPEFTEPKTGAEKYYKKLKRGFPSHIEVIQPQGMQFNTLGNPLELFSRNILNFRILVTFGQGAWIFQELSFRSVFILTNVFLSAILRRKIIVFVHEQFVLSEKLLKDQLLRIMNNVMFQSASKIVVNSKSTADWVKRFGCFNKKIIIFYPIVDDFIQEGGMVGRRSDGRKHILCVANIRKNKGQQHLIDALDFLNNKNIQLHFVGLVKEQVYYNNLIAQIKRKGYVDRVKFSGFLAHEDLLAVYKMADVFVLPTLNEGFGLVLLEAMAFGVPVVASNVGGIAEIINNGVNGFLIPPASPQKLAEAIEKILYDERCREYLIKNAWVKLQQFPRWEDSFAKLLESIEQ